MSESRHLLRVSELKTLTCTERLQRLRVKGHGVVCVVLISGSLGCQLTVSS